MPSSLEDLKVALADRYWIERELGRGGMAVVYLAHDLKHDRQVAVKVVQPELTAVIGAERFLNEIRVTANLQHPNILPLFDSGEANGFLYYVMPYVKGGSVRALLDRQKQLPIDRALEITKTVASALGHAHRHGVIHRDIKPENILLADDGQALVADFGIALAVNEAGGTRLTETGMSLGTPEYMSPEQATGDRQLEPASDIYSLGAVLYEMLVGDPPHMANTAQAIIARIMTVKPASISTVRDTVPQAVEAATMMALAKVPADRPLTAERFVELLEAPVPPVKVREGPTSTRPIERGAAPRRRVWWMAAGAAAAIVVVAVYGATQLRDNPIAITTSNIRQVTSDPGLEFQPSLSPGGEEVAYVVGRIGSPRVVVRSVINSSGGGETRLGEGVPGGLWFPSWTPDGASIRYRACEAQSNPLYRRGCRWMEVGKLGGISTPISVPNGPNSTYVWSLDGTRVAFSRGDSIFASSTGDTVPQLLGVQKRDPWIPHSFDWSPDGQLLAYVNGNNFWRSSGNLAGSSIWIIDAKGGDPVAITSEENMNLSPQWLPDSRHIVFISERDGPRSTYVVEVGPDGPLGDVQSVAGSSDPHSISLSNDGKKLAYSKFQLKQNIWSIPIPRTEVLSIGDAQPVTTGSQVIESHDLSPDGRFITFDGSRLGNVDIYRMPVAGGNAQLIEDLADDAFGPVWSPDGTEIAFHARTPGGAGIFVVSANGGDPRLIADFPGFDDFSAWSPDGLSIAFQSQAEDENGIWVVSRERVGDPWGDPVRLTDFLCYPPDWAPDGESLVCAAGSELVIVSKSGDVVSRFDPQMQVGYPRFSHDGSEVYFPLYGPAPGVWSVPVTGGEAMQLVAFDDPSRRVLEFLTVGPDHFYLTISEYESDIYVMDLEY